MSIRHLLRAAELQQLRDGDKMPPSHKLALMAIADDASDKSDQSFPGLEKVMVWASVGKRRALELIADLVDAGYITNVSPGYPGRRAVYQVHLLDPKPVDNSQKMGAESRTAAEMGAENPGNARDPAPLSVDPLPDNTQSLKEPHQGGAVLDAMTGDSPKGWVNRRRHRRATKHLDYQLLATLVGTVFDDVTDNTEDRATILRWTALAIVAKALEAGTHITDATAYVAASIKNEPEIHRRRAFEWAVTL